MTEQHHETAAPVHTAAPGPLAATEATPAPETTFTTRGAIPAPATAPPASPQVSASDRAYGTTDPTATKVPLERVIDGVTVLAPPGTHAEAIDQCASFIHAELGRNQLAQKKLAEARATIVIIPAHTPMTDVAQFAGMRGKKTFDGRDWASVRGSGGIKAPDGSFAIGVAEENLIAVRGVVSSYPLGYSIGMHELAHGLESHGMTSAQQHRLQELYKAHAAKDPGDTHDTFTEKYGASNVHEYFAQGTNAFFGKNARTGHNDRTWLQQHDPDLYAFLAEMYETDFDREGKHPGADARDVAS